MIEPTDEYLKQTINEGDNNGLWPLYIYNYGLKCSDISYNLFIHEVKDRVGKYPLYDEKSECIENKFYGSTHHTFSNKTKRYIYDIY